MYNVFLPKINKTDDSIAKVLYLECPENISSEWLYNYCQEQRQPVALRG
jgi:hypothetical protein